ncbi:MAG: C39 family peptidase [Candidatus Magasanikbacteria bacterium]|nr:C39 family peptidase [Candidatus Magasanikbacteria bacterium]
MKYSRLPKPITKTVDEIVSTTKSIFPASNKVEVEESPKEEWFKEKKEEPVVEEKSIIKKIVEIVIPPKIDIEATPMKVNHNVPFTSQAPFAQWDDSRYQDGCEEASVLMALRWANDENLSKEQATKEIAEMSAWEMEQWGSFHDSSTADTKRLLTEYYNYPNVELFYDITINDIKKYLADGKVVIIPSDGRLLNNPYFVAPGPEIHMLVIRGYDEKKSEFITNDPGTKRGEEFRYSYSTIMSSLRDYKTGSHETPLAQKITAILVVSKK